MGDVIVGVDDKPIRKVKDLFTALDARKVGDRIQLRNPARRGRGEPGSPANRGGMNCAQGPAKHARFLPVLPQPGMGATVSCNEVCIS